MAVEATLSSFSFQMTHPGHAVQPAEPVVQVAYELKDVVLGDLGIRVINIQEDDLVDEILDLLDKYAGSLATVSKLPAVKVRALARKADRQQLRAAKQAKDPKNLPTLNTVVGLGGV